MKRLLPVSTLRDRLGGQSPRTIDRLLADPPPGFPPIIWVNNRRFFAEEAVDEYIAQIIKAGTVPGKQRRDCRPKSSGARKPAKHHAETKPDVAAASDTRS